MVEKIKKEKRRKILVTGSSGMLGVDLCSQLHDKYDVVGLDKVKSLRLRQKRMHLWRKRRIRLRRKKSKVKDFLQCDITDRKKTIKSIVDASPDLIIHTAAWTDVDGCELDKKKAYKINSEGTRNIALACKKIGAILIYISTDFVFNGKKKRPYKETDKPNPISVYGDSKYRGEQTVKKILKKYFILRTSWLYGRYGKNFVDTILEKAKEEKELKVVDDQVGSPTYTKDLAKAIRILLHVTMDDGRWTMDDGWGIYHVSNKGEVSWFDYAKEILKMAKIKDVNVMPIKSTELDRPARRPAYSVLDNTKFEKMANFIMRPWQDTLGDYLNEKNK